MPQLEDMGRDDLLALRRGAQSRYERFKARGLSLNMTRGKPCAEQLDLANDMLTCVGPENYRAEDGTDCRNYGGLRGIPEARRLFAEYLDVAPDQLVVTGNSSLEMMHQAVARGVTHGVPGGEPWGAQDSVRWLCPCPGYDRHFTVCERFGIEMVVLDMLEDGPDMDAVEELAGSDERVKGIWCVPRYSNPTGVTYSADVVQRLASMPTAAPDFRLFWDNAYAVHHLTDDPQPLPGMMDACAAAGHPDRPLIFGSTSKVTFAGAGLGMMAASERNLEWFLHHMSARTIGPDKLNQLRHVRFLGDMEGIRRHMRRHAEILRPKFDAVTGILREELGGKGIAEWTEPDGGYFISVNVPDGCARRIVQMAGEAGVRLTPAGATFPYGEDPRDRNIRIAPTFPPLEELRQATELLAVCVQLVAAEKLLGPQMNADERR
ncbi:MAG: aminotransferase class I/II-fold pyridoxal phosphate-dependent enzyme [Candidatus Brocadiia bacterium]